MKKRLLMILCVVSIMFCILALYASFTVTGSGFLDVSNIAQYVCYGAAALFGLSAIASFVKLANYSSQKSRVHPGFHFLSHEVDSLSKQQWYNRKHKTQRMIE